jgi:type I restriction enzyme M protein
MNKNGRAGFVMSSQGSSAGSGEKEIRRKLIESGAVDVMIAIHSNFFYTLSVPCDTIGKNLINCTGVYYL